MASISSLASTSLPTMSGSMSTATEMANALYNNPDLAPLFKEMPHLINELRSLDKEQISNILFLFRIYSSLPPALLTFFHNAVSKIKSAAPVVRDLATFNIAAELTTYVQSVTKPVNNMFSSIARYIPKVYRRAAGKGPAWGSVAKTVGGILVKNIGVPPPLIPFNILRQGLTQLSTAYINGNLKMPRLPKVPGKIKWKPLKDVISPKKPRVPKVSKPKSKPSPTRK